MSKTIDISTSLKRLIEQDRSLMTELKAAKDVEQARALILRSAAQQGMAIDVGELEQELAPIARLTSSLLTLEQLMEADPLLEPAMRKAEHLEEAVELITVSAQRQGVTLDVGELVEQMRMLDDQAGVGELSDEELADVSGGSVVGLVIGGAILGGAVIGVVGAGYGIGVLIARLESKRK